MAEEREASTAGRFWQKWKKKTTQGQAETWRTEAAEHVGTAQYVAVIDQKVALRTVQVLTLEEQTEIRKEDSVWGLRHAERKLCWVTDW